MPEYLDIQKDPELLRLYPWIEEAVLDEQSITAMEMQYGVLDDPTSATGARFYFRRQRASLDLPPLYSGEGRGRDADGETRKLDELKERIRASGVAVQEFRDAASLGEMVYDDLIEIIRRDFAHAESGSGKSALVSFWCQQLRTRTPEQFIVEHYVGIGAGDTDHLGLIRHVMQEVKERFGREEELPSTPQEIERGFGQWLGYASHELKQRGERMLLVLDGLNQLEGVALQLQWIPDVMSPEIRLIVTSTVEGTLVGLRKRGWTELGMQPLSEAEREAVVVRYLSEYHKALPGVVVKEIASDIKCAHPLFLRTMLEELRLYGEHERIERYVERLLECTGTEDLFQRVLERMEEDYNLRAVRDAMIPLWASRSGLAEEELSEITGISRLKLSTLLLGLDYHLVRRDGLLSFFHDYLRRAVEKRYLSDGASRHAMHQKLGAYFERVEITDRSASELIYQYRQSMSWKELAMALSRMERFMVLWHGETMYEVLGDWRTLGEHGLDIEASYREALTQWVPEEGRSRLEGVWRVAELYGRLGHWEAAAELYRQVIVLAEAEADSARSGAGYLGLGGLRKNQGRYDEAMESLATARTIYEQLGDRRGLSNAIGNMDNVYADRGEYEPATACYAEQESICRELGNRSGLSLAIGNMGLVYADRGEYDRALECYVQKESISHELGNRNGLANVIGNIGNVYYARGEYDRLLECLGQQESICRDIGDRRGGDQRPLCAGIPRTEG